MRALGEGAMVGRYLLDDLIGSGGMARVYVGRLEGWAGFSTRVAIKRLHPDLAADPDFSAMLLDEARLTGRIRHPNVVGTIDVVREQGEFLLVMEYVVGVSLEVLLKRCRTRQEPVPLAIAASLVVGILSGLHAAHEATDTNGEPLRIVHRDVSPQNVLVEENGLAKLLDFGIATAANRLSTTKEGTVKGKPAYIAPEQIMGPGADRRADIFSVGVLLWEMLTNTPLREDPSFTRVLRDAQRSGTELDVEGFPRGPSRALAEIARRAMAIEPADRFTTALAMAAAVDAAVTPASLAHVGAWCEALAPEVLHARRVVSAGAPAKAEESTQPVAPVEQRAVVSDVTDAHPRRRRGVIVVVAAMLFATLGMGGVLYRSRAVASTKLPVASVARTPTSADLEPIAAPSPLPVATPSASGSATVSRSTHVASPGVRKAAPPRVVPVRDACRIPFVVDDAGIKRPKRECL